MSFPGLAWLACLKQAEGRLELLSDIDMLLMVKKKRIGGGLCHAILRYAKANNKYMESYNKCNDSSYIHYLDTNNLYGLAMSQM